MHSSSRRGVGKAGVELPVCYGLSRDTCTSAVVANLLDNITVASTKMIEDGVHVFNMSINRKPILCILDLVAIILGTFAELTKCT